jgi:anaerobic C4-dicarboxylate transporter
VARQTDYSTRWLALNVDAKNKIKQEALMCLGSPSQKAGIFASQVVAAIAAVELPVNQWADLIELLLSFVNNQTNANLKIATLQTIGFICEVIVRLDDSFQRVLSQCYCVETGDSESALERNFDGCYSWCEEGGDVTRGSTRGYSCPIQLA